jgi:general secretion pathway protein M
LKVELTPSSVCAVAWLVLVLAPLAIVLTIVLFWHSVIRDLDAQIAVSRDQLVRYQDLLSTLPALRAELDRAQANEDFKAFYFDADTASLAGAQLQREVQEMVRVAGSRPISAQILPVGAEEKPLKVRVRIQLQGTTDELLEVLYRVEAARPFLFVDQMSIRSTTARVRQVAGRVRSRTRRVNSQEVGSLTVRLDVFAYVLAPGQ